MHASFQSVCRELATAAKEAGISSGILHLPGAGKTGLSGSDCERIDVAYLSRDIRFGGHYGTFGDAMFAARNIKWVHFSSIDIDTRAADIFAVNLVKWVRGQPLLNERQLELNPVEFKKWMCILCGFVCDEAAGIADEGIAPGTRWEDVPADWTCPHGPAAKADFEMIEMLT